MTRKRTPGEIILAVYLALTLPLYFVVGEYSPAVWGMYALHVLGLLYFVFGFRLWFKYGQEDNVSRDLLPMFVCVALYIEVAWLNRAFFPDRYLDAWIIAWEHRIFASHPAMDFREAFPSRVLSEYLHFGYFAYYFLMPSMVVAVFVKGGKKALRMATSTVALVFVAGFVVFILVPVAGPYYEYPRMDLSGTSTFFPRIARWVVDQGSAVGTAFPSSHVAVSVTVWMMCLRYARSTGLAMILIVPALALGAIYGGFHYAIDVAVGAVLGLLVSSVGHKWVQFSLQGE